MSIENTPEGNIDFDRSGYKLFREGSVRRLNPGLFAVRKEDGKGWVIVELKEGKWVCDGEDHNAGTENDQCPHVYAALLSSVTQKAVSDQTDDELETRSIKCRYCGSPDISRVGFRYNARGISRRYLCNECRRKFSVPYVEPHAVHGLPSGTLWLLSQVAMLTSKLNELLSDLEERTMSAVNTSQSGDEVP
jgi:DNA-directed RNA polymerase subunit RPC12/RpoP